MIVLFLAAAATQFDPVAFFRGPTQGIGTLEAIFQRTKTIRVDSLGTEQKEGTLLPTQTIREPGKTPRIRTWHMRREGPDRYSGAR